METRARLRFLTVHIHPVAKNPGCFENHHPPGPELKILGRLGISPPPGGFIFDNEFSESAYQKIFTLFKAAFDNLQQFFDNRSGLFFAQPYLIINIRYDIFFSKRHGNPPDTV
jgi:hypothetical protein